MAANPAPLHELQTALYALQVDTQSRLDRIESALAVIIQLVQHQTSMPLMMDDKSESQMALPSPTVSSPNPSVSAANEMKLRISDVETTWFTKRPYPTFQVEVVDQHGQIVTRTPHWRLRLRLLCGTGLYVDRFLNSPSLDFAVHDGRATISGLKFSAVTSRNGGHFRLEFSLRHPDNEAVLPVLSPPLRVLSERLKNELKAASASELRPSDPLVRVPGIGKRYTTKLAERGFHTLGDLRGAFDKTNPDEIKAVSIKQFVQEIERDRGSLTSARISNILQEAAQVDDDDEHDHDHDQQSTVDTDKWPDMPLELDSPILDDAFDVDSFLDPNALQSPAPSSVEPPLKRPRLPTFQSDYPLGTLLSLATMSPSIGMDRNHLLIAS